MERVQPTVMLLGEHVLVPGRKNGTHAKSSQLKIAATTLEPIQVMPFANVEITTKTNDTARKKDISDLCNSSS